MANPIARDLSRLAAAIGPEPDDLIEEMDAYADQHGFPTVGPAVGGWLELLARVVGARRVFEFGSGYGYSAYWFARALPADGEIVLTEVDADELDLAREYLDRGGVADRATFEHGDAIAVVEEYDGPFDVVLIDNEKHRYAEAFEAVRGKIPVGGVVVADNAVAAGSIDFDAVLSLVEGEHADASAATRGIATFLTTLRDDPAFQTGLIPVGEGIAVAFRTN
jgi:predicted O-methyltransferase YrrM